jgi:hypothetical protein
LVLLEMAAAGDSTEVLTPNARRPSPSFSINLYCDQTKINRVSFRS